MAVPALAFSEAFREKLESGKMKGTVLAGEWKIPEGRVAIFCSNVGESGGAEIAGYSDAAELRASVKKWHGCKDTGTVTFVEWE